MKEKKQYYIISIFINILMCMGGYYTLIFGLLGMIGLLNEPSINEMIFGLIIYVGTYIVIGLINFVMYKIFKNRFNLERKHFIIPTIHMYILGTLFTLLLLT